MAAVPQPPALPIIHWSTGDARWSGDVARFAARAFDPYYREVWTEAQILALLATSDSWLDLAQGADGELLAFALCRMVADEAELLLCATHPDYRRLGLGRALMEKVRHSSGKRGCTSLFLEVRDSNSPALGLYTISGFSVVGRRPGYYQTRDGKRLDGLTLRVNIK